MKNLDKKTIYNLPFHDSNLLGAKISQKDNGETDLLLCISFCRTEFEDLSNEYLEINKSDGSVALLFETCQQINFNFICDRTQRDEIDYIQFLTDSVNLKQGQKHVEVIFISGSKLECIAEKVVLVESNGVAYSLLSESCEIRREIRDAPQNINRHERHD